MNGVAALVRIIFWLTLVLWIGALISGGVAATAVFSILPDLDVELTQFDAYPREEHGRLAAGLIMEPVFTAIDAAQVVLAVVVMIALAIDLWLTHKRRWRAANVLRILALAVAVGTLGWRITRIMPEMNQNLRAYQEAALNGELTLAESHRASFDVAHPTAVRFMETTLVALLVLAGAAAVCAVPHKTPSEPGALQEPELLKRNIP